MPGGFWSHQKRMDETKQRREWEERWKKLGSRILQFPDWMQKIVLDDINTAIENRIKIMEMISRKVTGQPA